MEPIGATASIVTLLVLSKEIAGRGQILIRRYREYPKALGEIRDRILQLEVQLSLLSNVQQNIRDAGFLSSDAGAQLSDTLSNTQRTFESIRDYLAQRSEEGGTRARLRWVRKDEAEVEKWVEKLTRHGHSLNVVLNILQVQLWSLSAKVNEASNGKLALMVKHQVEERQAKIIARSREIRNKKKRAASDSDNGVLWSFLLNLPIDFRYLAFLRNYTINFSVMYRQMKTQNVVPKSAEIFKACKSGDAFGVKLLLDANKASPHDVAPDGSTPLEYAIESGSMPLVQLLVDCGADPDAPFVRAQIPPVASAFKERKLDIARFLHSRGADIDSTDVFGWTPLIYFLCRSSSKNSHQIVEYLEFLSSASFLDVNAQSLDCETSMHFAAADGNALEILELIRRNASLSAKTKSLQRSPIFYAVHYGNFSTFEVLADHQPEYLKEKDIQGWTLLHVAASPLVYFSRSSSQAAVKNVIVRLLKDGADVHALSDARATINVPNKLLGRAITPVDVARASGRKLFKLFLEVLKELDMEVRIIWEGCECDRLYWDGIDDVCEKCDECDVFFPSVSF